MKYVDQQPLLTIVLPVYNVGHYLAACLDSLMEQSYENIEIIAIDDLSKDDSWKILKLYKKVDKRLRIYKNVKHYGKAITLNRILRKAKGHYLVFMDAKDMVYKNKFRKQLSYLEDNTKIVGVGTQCTFINSAGRKTSSSTYPLHPKHIYQRPLHGISVDFETLMINKALLPKDALYFSPTSGLLYSDVIMTLLQYGEITNLPLSYQYRRTENPNRSTTLSKIPSIIKLWLKSIDSYDYKPSIRSLLSPFKQPDLSTQ